MANKVYGFCDAGCRYPVATMIAGTVTLLANGWSNSAQTVNIEGVTGEDEQAVIVSPAPDSFSAYNAAGVKCSAQGDGTLTFTCSTKPTVSLSVNVAIFS